MFIPWLLCFSEEKLVFSYVFMVEVAVGQSGAFGTEKFVSYEIFILTSNTSIKGSRMILSRGFVNKLLLSLLKRHIRS